jgi:hypothetical protein
MLIFANMNWPRIAADLVLIAHVAFIGFVLFGLVVTWLGILFGWRWVRGFGFRAAHLLAIGFVVIQAYFGIVCPLTVLENNLRVRGGQQAYGSRGFISHWLHNLIFFDAPSWVFTLCYTLFGLLVIGTLLLAPPNRPRWWRTRGATRATAASSSA